MVTRTSFALDERGLGVVALSFAGFMIFTSKALLQSDATLMHNLCNFRLFAKEKQGV